jgi:assimilatory nitrate reductase catalytic subunit
MMSTQIIGRAVLLLSVSGPHEGAAKTVEFARPSDGASRALRLRGGVPVSVEVLGDATGIGHLAARMVTGRALSEAEQARFRWTGSTAATRAPAGLVCPCVGLARDEATTMVEAGLGFEAIGQRCGAGTICGSCRPEIESLGRPRAPAKRPGLLRRLLRRKPAKG